MVAVHMVHLNSCYRENIERMPLGCWLVNMPFNRTSSCCVICEYQDYLEIRSQLTRIQCKWCERACAARGGAGDSGES